MNMIKILFIVGLTLFTSFRCDALEIKFDNYVVAKEPDRPCYLVETIMYSVDDHGIKFVMGRSQVWIGDCDCRIVPRSNPDCAPVDITGLQVYTSLNSPACINAVLNKADVISAYLQSLDAFISADKQAKGQPVLPVVSKLRVYPNPATASVNVETAIKDFKGRVWVKVHDLSGRAVYTDYLRDPLAGFIRISTGGWPCGQYHISMGDDERLICTQKVSLHQ